MKLHLKYTFGYIIFFAIFLFYSPVHAATLELALEKDIVSPKDDVVVLVTINSEGQDVNTAQATISFPTDLLEVTKIDQTDSVFSFWLQQPSFDNTKGTISFVGGSINGFNGSGLKIMHLAFKVKGSGSGKLGVTDGAITASDGTGTNVYTTAKGLDITIPTTADFQSINLERSLQQATIAKKLPTSPSLNIPFYPDPTKWNNRSASFKADWNISGDITQAGISLDKNSNSTPQASSEALIGHKIFPALTDGIWYIHLRVANNVGWGTTLHYRIAVDTTPPTSFKIISSDGFKTENPKPNINFISSDLGSNINNYIIRLDGIVIDTVNSTSYTFSPLLPGVHKLSISAVDKAGNSTSQNETLEILPIASPVITYVSRSIIVDAGNITAGGTAQSGVEVVVQIQNAQKQIIAEQKVPVDSSGNWNITFNKSLTEGNYNILVTSRDKNMASSFPTISPNINVKQKPILVLGSLEITQIWFFIILIIILLCSFGAGYFTFYQWKGKLGRRVTIAQRDVINILDNTKNDIDKLLKNFGDGVFSKSDSAEMEYTLKNIKENLEKSRRYVVDNIREINK